jgi:hypothetical protein
VAALYSGMRALPGARAAGRVKLLAGLNQEVFERTRRASYAGIWVTA